jgi:phosphoribosylanthranilate isomerase
MTKQKTERAKPFNQQRRATPYDTKHTHKPSPERAQSNETDYALAELGNATYPNRKTFPHANDKRSSISSPVFLPSPAERGRGRGSNMLIKVCGMRNPENICAVETLDIDLMGFIFYPRSPRFVHGDAATIEAIRRCRKRKAGVFVDETPENMLETAALYRLDCLQLHGTESPDLCNFLRTKGYGIIKSFPVGSTAELENTDNYRTCVDYLLFDTKSAAYGGSGKRFDWSLLNGYAGNIPFLLSGGLSPDCLQDVLRFRHPRFAGIDLNSGFETSPALKDVEKLKDYLTNIQKHTNYA